MDRPRLLENPLGVIERGPGAGLVAAPAAAARGDGRVRGVHRAHAGRRTLGAAASEAYAGHTPGGVRSARPHPRRTPGTHLEGVCSAGAVVKSLDLDQVW